MNLKTRILSFTTAGALATGAALVAGIGVAHAAPVLGNLSITPATGNQDTLLTATTDAACNADDTGYNVYLSGPGITGEAPMQSNTPYGGSGNLSFPVGSTFGQVFADNSVASPNGAYTVRVACVGPDFFAETGEFRQVANFTPNGQTNGGNYQMVVPAQSTNTVLSQSAGSTDAGQSVTFTANVDPDAAGTVQFKDGAGNLGTPQTVDAAGIATFTTSSLSVGSHTISSVFTPSSSAFNGSTSNNVTHTVNAVATSMALSSNGPTALDAPATFTATVTPAAAGTVAFTVDGGTPVNRATNASGVATYTTSALTVGAHTVTAHFTPAAGSGASEADAGPITHNVDDLPPGAVTENITVTVPTGALTIALDDGADGDVDLGLAQLNAAGDLFTASGEMDIVLVTDTRAGDDAWTASGVVTDFSNGTDSFNGYNLGWDPSLISKSAHQTINEGPVVAAGSEELFDSVPGPGIGLETSRVLATSVDGASIGTARLGALLSVNIPTDVTPGTYSALLTLTVA